MSQSNSVRRAVRRALLSGAAASFVAAIPAQAQDANIQEIVVTGTRISVPGAESSSPILSVGAAEIESQLQPEVEKILRVLPITVAGDGQNANNGSAGAATVNLRGLGPQRNLVLINGKRATPYNYNGLVDTSTIPTALIERIDIVTGGASAVYGSDAIAGAINFVLRSDYEGVDLNYDMSQYDAKDGALRTASLTLGANMADGRGNVVLGINWSDRKPVKLGDRPLGQFGIDTETGANYQNYLDGVGATLPPAGCGGPNAVAAGGSGTTLPTRVGIAGGGAIGQFREDGTIGSNCSLFNFNPYNYYQTPLERFGGSVLGRFELDEHAEVYARFGYSSTTVRTQVAPSGIFGSAFWTPLANSFIGAGARATIIDAFNAGRAGPNPVVSTGGELPNWRDVNGNNVVDVADDVRITYGRRTVEFGERSTVFDNNAFQFVVGTRGDLVDGWDYDVSLQYGESNRTSTFAGFTNVANAANAIDAVPDENGVLTCRNGDPTCVPLNLFGGFGAITREMAAYSSATAIEQQFYDQTIATASVSGPLPFAHIPWASSPIAVSFGAEYREERGETVPDECLKLAPSSCLGGAGGNTLPVAGGFDVKEIFGEAIIPVASDLPGMQSMDVELGYRHADYNLTGTNETYKYGLSWRPLDQLLVRAMKQRAARAPNVGELSSPQITALDNATRDPCSVANATNLAANASLRALCASTGMTAGQIGVVPNIVVGQINSFRGTDLQHLPNPEVADTLTLGLVWTPAVSFINNPVISLDYYEMDIQDVIGRFGAQEVLDACYVAGLASECAKIRRIGGGLTLDGSGIETWTTNLKFLRAEGIELGFSFAVELGSFGNLAVSGNVNKYLTHESQSSDTQPVMDCLGKFGTNCGNGPQGGPLPEMRWVQRTTWTYGDLSVSGQWRHMGSVESEVPQSVFPAFRKIDSYDYFDLYASYTLMDKVRVSLGIVDVFEKDPPVVGNEAADTTSNSGNTFPSSYNVLGRMYSLGVNMSF
jgi:iron complex outermembrane receptor protein